MDESQVLSELFRITGALEPVGPTTNENLAELRRRLAHSLFDLPGAGISAFFHMTEESREVLQQLQAIVATVVQQRATPGASPPRSRVLRRELPVRSANQPTSFPARSGGHAITRTFGPLLEARERFVHFDLVEAQDLVRVVRGNEAPFLLLPTDANTIDGFTFTFTRGSVWIRADHVAANANGFVGFRVAQGTLKLRQSATRNGNKVALIAQAECTLTVRLEATAVVNAPDDQPGKDARSANATRPQEVSFELSPQGARRITSDATSLAVYGATVNLTRGADPAIFLKPIDCILVPFTPDRQNITPQPAQSTLLQSHGSWDLGHAGWLLPISIFTSADDLGEAADAGALALEVKKGFRATWGGLVAGPYTADHAWLIADSRELSLIAEGRSARIARQELALWRASSLDLLFEDAFRVHFVSSRQGVEVCGLIATVEVHIDRPLQADGRRLRLRLPEASAFISHHPSGDETLHVYANRQVHPGKVVPLALANALLQTTEAEALTLFGLIVERRQLAGASLRLTFALQGILPFLPDPYAASFDIPRPDFGSPQARLSVSVTWSGPDVSALAISLIPLDRQAVNLPRTLLPRGRAAAEPPENERFLDFWFNRTVSTKAAPDHPLFLLDLSSNASQFGIGTAFPEARDHRSSLAVSGPYLSASVNDLRAFALPQVQWEPVRTRAEDLAPGFPQPLISRGDGDPLLVGAETQSVHLVPIAPEPVLRELVAVAEQSDSAFAVKFTLPFGIKAVAAVRNDFRPESERPMLRMNQPEFGPMIGGLQITLQSGTPAGIPGGAVQTRNSTSNPAKSVLDDDVEGFFNFVFHPQSDVPKRVPISRVDFSGYGESTFSKWINENAAPLDVTKVEFDVMVGRTSYEVVEIQSILWPCMARVVRRITIRREGSGHVLRRDSGWVAATPGLFHRPDSACVFHPGIVKGMFNIREIRDTPQLIRLTSNVDLRVVFFDTDLAMGDVARGYQSEGVDAHGQRVRFVPSLRQVGFVQLINLTSPQQTPLTPAQLKELLDKHGPVGGPVDSELDIAQSGQRFRTSSIFSAAAAKPGSADSHFAVAAYGAPKVPREGQWSVTRLRRNTIDEAEPEPVDPQLGVPLIRVGDTQLSLAANSNAYRFADPVDLFQAAQPSMDYALLFTTDTFRVLFPRMKIDPGDRRLTSDLAPLLADSFAMLTAVGLFPRQKHAIAFPSNAYELQIVGEGALRLAPEPLTHTVPQRSLDVMKAAGLHVFTEYRGGDRHQTGPARIELRFNSNAQPSWALKIGPISTVSDIDPFGQVTRLITTHEANSIDRPRATKPLMEFGGALRPVEELVTVMKEFGIPADMFFDAPNSSEKERSYKLKFGLVLNMPETHILGKMEGKLTVGFEFGTKKRKVGAFPLADTGAEVEISAEAEGKVLLPIIEPIYGGGLIRLQLTTGYDSEVKEMKREIKLSAAAVGNIGVKLAKLVKVEGEVRYGYVFVADFAKKEYYPGVLIGLALEASIGIGEVAKLFKIAFEQELIGLLRRIDSDYIHIKAEFTIAGELEICALLSIEYTLETEWEQRLPMKEIAILAAAIQFGLVPLPPVPP